MPSVTLSVYETCMRGELLIPVVLWLVFKLSNAKVGERDMRQIKKNILAFVDSYHSLCRDKKDIILSEIQACEILLMYPRDENDHCWKRDFRAKISIGSIAVEITESP